MSIFDILFNWKIRWLNRCLKLTVSYEKSLYTCLHNVPTVYNWNCVTSRTRMSSPHTHAPCTIVPYVSCALDSIACLASSILLLLLFQRKFTFSTLYLCISVSSSFRSFFSSRSLCLSFSTLFLFLPLFSVCVFLT